MDSEMSDLLELENVNSNDTTLFDIDEDMQKELGKYATAFC